jgi:hypothetical protein
MCAVGDASLVSWRAMPPLAPRRYWFPAKRYGWGWGPPIAWQGWAILIVWLLALLLGMRYVVPHELPLKLAFLLGMSLVLVLICWLTGEPPRWRWGDRD